MEWFFLITSLVMLLWNLAVCHQNEKLRQRLDPWREFARKQGIKL